MFYLNNYEVIHRKRLASSSRFCSFPFLESTKAMMGRIALSDWDNPPTFETSWQPFSLEAPHISAHFMQHKMQSVLLYTLSSMNNLICVWAMYVLRYACRDRTWNRMTKSVVFAKCFKLKSVPNVYLLSDYYLLIISLSSLLLSTDIYSAK